MKRLMVLMSIVLIFSMISFVSAVCTQTDSGLDLYTKGSATGTWLGDINGSSETLEDFCSDSYPSVLEEANCEETSKGSGVYGLVQTAIECTSGCNDGACIPISCEDSDNGDNFYKKGSVTVVAEDIEDRDDDACVSNKLLAEQSCVNGQQKTSMFECPGDCKDGVCEKIQTCSDSDEGNNPFEKGILVANLISSTTGEMEEVESIDYCVGDGGIEEVNVVEHYCIDDGMGGQNFNSISVQCLNGCEEGACLKIEPTEETGPIELPEDLTDDEEANEESEEVEDEDEEVDEEVEEDIEEIIEEEKKIMCNGCVLDDKCYPFGFRKSDNFCSNENNQFIEQKQSESLCNNNFECSSNVCVNDECISKGLLKKIIDWFRKLFDFSNSEKVNLQKKNEKYLSSSVFIIGSEDWEKVLSLVPVTSWSGKEKWCRQGSQTADETCTYPLLIIHQENEVEDIKPIHQFLEEYNTSSVVTFDISNSEELFGEYVFEEEVFNQDTLLNFWEGNPKIIVSDNNYENALLGSTYAGLKNIPFFVESIFSYSEGMDLICLGDVNLTCGESMSKEDIEEKIAGIAGKDRLVLTSSRDLNEGYTIPDDKPASFGIRNLFTKASLLAPILAITKKQSLLVTPESTISLVKQDIDNFVTRHDLNPNTITILASPGIVPHSQYGTTRWDTVTQSFFQIDGAIYGSSLNDYYQDVSVGRIFGFSSSDVSSYIARVLSFVSVKQGDEAKMISCRISSPVQYSPSIVSELLGDSMNLENERFYGDFDLQNLLDKRVIVYEGHGNEVGTLCGFTTDNLRSEDIYLNQALVIHSAACLTCSYGVALSADTLDSFFCAELIRRGAIGVLGATDVSATNVAGVDILDPLLEGENLGESFRLMSIKDYSSLSYYHEPFHTLIGDPTLRIFDETYDLNEKVEVLKSEWREDDTGSVYYHMELSFSSSDINSFNLPTGELLYETDAYYGDNVKSSYIYRLERDPTDYNEEKFVKLNVDVNNPSHLNFQSISSAKVIIDGNEIDVSSGFISNPLNVINRLDTTHLEIPVVLSFVDLESSSVPSFTLIVDFEITE